MTPLFFVHDVLPWIMSAITLYMTFLQGRKRWGAWVVGLINQLLWLTFIITTQTWGLMPLNIGLWILYWRNLFKWYDDEKRMQFLRDELAAANYVPSTEPTRFYNTTDELRRSK